MDCDKMDKKKNLRLTNGIRFAAKAARGCGWLGHLKVPTPASTHSLPALQTVVYNRNVMRKAGKLFKTIDKIFIINIIDI